jgi:hypothetical protein
MHVKNIYGIAFAAIIFIKMITNAIAACNIAFIDCDCDFGIRID